MGHHPTQMANTLGFALMHFDTPHQNGTSKIVLRRYFWLWESDRSCNLDSSYAVDVSAEALDPRTAVAGQPVWRIPRMFRKRAL